MDHMTKIDGCVRFIRALEREGDHDGLEDAYDDLVLMAERAEQDGVSPVALHLTLSEVFLETVCGLALDPTE